MNSERIYKGNIYRAVQNKTVQKQQMIEKENAILIKALNENMSMQWKQESFSFA